MLSQMCPQLLTTQSYPRSYAGWKLGKSEEFLRFLRNFDWGEMEWENMYVFWWKGWWCGSISPTPSLLHPENAIRKRDLIS
jgi:hypothetical protein